MTAGRLAVHLVRGDDPVLVGDAARALVAELLDGADPSLAVTELDAGDPGEAGPEGVVAAAVDAAQTPPLLTGHRVVVLRDVGSLPAAAVAPLTAYLADPMPTTSLVLVSAGGRVPQALGAAVKKAGRVVDAGVPRTAKARTSWLDAHLAGAPVRLEPRARRAVEQHLGEDLGRLQNLLAALAAAYGAGARVTEDDLAPFLGEAGSVPPWELTDAIDRGDATRAQVALRRMTTAGGRHPLQVMAVLHAHVERMLRLDGSGATSERQAAEVLGLTGSTFPAKKALDQSRRLGSAGIARAVTLLADADLDLRGASEWPDQLVLEVLVARLCRLARR